ncbi:L-rhamnose mutarotase [Tellurirhabdus bombi]|uniref:L-rhamnose mutarotase n=1 Tax=Tellurirhabdus bombi TaxID=2907205 RepID=UPI001F16942E|nr:L-rhamnose mutarotase [Tellurirhabdus bombi]
MRYCFALDLVDDPILIAEYEKHHERIWPEIRESIQAAGITVMDIYRTGNRLFMIMETDESFSFARKAEMDASNPVVQKWETLMWGYQQSLPTARPGEKWVLMNQIFKL